MVIASANDPWVSLERAQYFAENWGSTFINIGDAGHINAASGHGEWPEGLRLLQQLG
jgi:predicted alpha/beta hydrolase family esterase